jgi:hypothetical protein
MSKDLQCDLTARIHCTVSVFGLTATVRIQGSEVANDNLIVNGLAGSDTITTGAGVTGLIGVVFNQ